MKEIDNHKLIDLWFPCAAVDDAVGGPAGSGRSEKAIFTWFASRPIAQARAAVLCSLIPDTAQNRIVIEAAIRSGDSASMNTLTQTLAALYPSGRPVVLDMFSGRGIIPLEAARVGAVAVGIDCSPLATLAGRLLADYPLRDWNGEPPLPFLADQGTQSSLEGCGMRLVDDCRTLFLEIDRRVVSALEQFFPRNSRGEFPWAYLWATTIPCDVCSRRFPLLGDLTLRNPYHRTKDQGQSFRLITDGDRWDIEVFDGVPDQLPTFRAAPGRRGKTAHCPFCRHPHSLDTVKAKGFAREYRDAILLAADIEGDTKKVFRRLTAAEVHAIERIDLNDLPKCGRFSAVPDEPIPAGNVHTVRGSGYGYRTYGDLMCSRQALQFAVAVRGIRECFAEMLSAGLSREYATALASYAAANLARRVRRATRGSKLLAHGSTTGAAQNRVQAGDIYSDESKVAFNFDFIEAGIGDGPGTWRSLSGTGIESLSKLVAAARGRPGRFHRGSAMALPLRDGTVDAVVTDPPYYNMIDYSDASDVFFVWVKRALCDIAPELFDVDGLQDKQEEIIVKNGGTSTEHRTKEFYENSLSKAFAEARRVLRQDGHLVVVFGHSDPEAWKRLLGALHQAGFIVTSSWPSRTESANTGVASIKVTVTIGCRVAEEQRPTVMAGQVDREVAEAVRARVKGWEADGLALTDQLMAAYGPAMEVYGRYSEVVTPEGQAPIDRYLTLARTAVRDAMALKLDQIPLETFDSLTRFAVFWLRLYGRVSVPKGEARFQAQADELLLEDVRGDLLDESTAGFKLVLSTPGSVDSSSPVWNVVRAMAAAWTDGGSESVANIIVKGERAPDDQHLWAVVGELVTQLPPSDPIAKALTAIQRNRTTIQNLSRGMVSALSSKDSALALGLQES